MVLKYEGIRHKSARWGSHGGGSQTKKLYDKNYLKTEIVEFQEKEKSKFFKN